MTWDLWVVHVATGLLAAPTPLSVYSHVAVETFGKGAAKWKVNNRAGVNHGG
jgi:hypothetical protein